MAVIRCSRLPRNRRMSKPLSARASCCRLIASEMALCIRLERNNPHWEGLSAHPFPLCAAKFNLLATCNVVCTSSHRTVFLMGPRCVTEFPPRPELPFFRRPPSIPSAHIVLPPTQGGGKEREETHGVSYKGELRWAGGPAKCTCVAASRAEVMK